MTAVYLTNGQIVNLGRLLEYDVKEDWITLTTEEEEEDASTGYYINDVVEVEVTP